MELKSISIDPRAIILRVVANSESGDDTKDLIESKITAPEEPLPSFSKAFEALPSVFCEILEVGKEWAQGLVITKLTISRTKHATRSVTLYGTKQLECRAQFLHRVSTPMVQIDKAADGESGAVVLEKKLVAAIARAVLEAEKYMNGERSQQLLDFDQAKAGLQALADKGKDKDQQSLALP